ncbi:hypothetical protein L861_01910 [Litchfieldella anticariensis FP35 = DSM 16096]|uniref:Polysaccharide chain length determinant N-terminal domain-containing protein n=1 Tax=Litchfieldella anticariensis (strain DSM 16096 / CECT 5854 / CIP 108499 / LMG 22089 / FP35) TaxID=1121939 RepID=S2KPQ4_LITA3|nr:hypothetical protein [Halomonas anticariensis]EPC04087.1 hypothetical protein L861_01910 [Halomonas anticariensis FP35 = DSM 16096]
MTPSYAASDNVSLIDLTVLLVRRWKIMLAICLAVMLATSVYAFARPTLYQYTSLYHIAEKYVTDEETSGELEPLSGVIAQLQTLVLPTAIRAFLADQGLDAMPFDVNVSQVGDNEQLVVLKSESTEAQSSDVETLHRKVLEGIQALQNERVERLQHSLEMRLAGTKDAVASAEGNAGLGVTTSIIELESQLAALEKGQISQLAVISLEPVGVSNGLILALGIIFGIIFATTSVFFLHFVGLVNQSMQKDGN